MVKKIETEYIDCSKNDWKKDEILLEKHLGFNPLGDKEYLELIYIFKNPFLKKTWIRLDCRSRFRTYIRKEFRFDGDNAEPILCT